MDLSDIMGEREAGELEAIVANSGRADLQMIIDELTKVLRMKNERVEAYRKIEKYVAGGAGSDFLDCAECGKRLYYGVDVEIWTSVRTSDGQRVCNGCNRKDNGGDTMKSTEKYVAGEMVEIVTRGGSVARQRKIARVTKTLVILDNGRRYRKKGGTDVSFKWSYDSVFFIRPAPMTEATQ